MEQTQLKATLRSENGKGPSRRLRASGKIPSVAYGKGNAETVSIAVEHDALLAILASERGRNTVIKLEIESGTSLPVMVRDFAIHPISRKLLHADFFSVDENTPIEVEVPFRTTGKAKGEVVGGTLLVTMRHLPVRCLPAKIPGHLEVDVTELDMEESLRVKDLPLPEGIEVLLPSERRIVSVKAPKMVEEGAAAAAPAEGETAGAAAPAAAPAGEGKS